MNNNIQVSHTDILKNKALMVRLTRKKINRNKMDKTLGDDLRADKNVTEAGAVRVNKSLFSKTATDKYMAVYSDASKYFYRVTLPWDDKGWRLLSIDIYKDFVKRFKGFTTSYRKEVLDFIENIESSVEEAKTMLGDAFNRDDYKFLAPNGSVNTDMLLEQFSLEVDYNTVTSGDDLRAALTEADREVIADQINTQAMEKFAKAQEHIVVSLRDCVFSIHERLCGSENVFRDTLITNLEELVDLIPKMNIAGDADINRIAAEAKLKLAKWEPQTLREDPKARAEVSTEAKKILDNLDGMI